MTLCYVIGGITLCSLIGGYYTLQFHR